MLRVPIEKNHLAPDSETQATPARTATELQSPWVCKLREEPPLSRSGGNVRHIPGRVRIEEHRELFVSWLDGYGHALGLSVFRTPCVRDLACGSPLCLCGEKRRGGQKKRQFLPFALSTHSGLVLGSSPREGSTAVDLTSMS